MRLEPKRGGPRVTPPVWLSPVPPFRKGQATAQKGPMTAEIRKPWGIHPTVELARVRSGLELHPPIFLKLRLMVSWFNGGLMMALMVFSGFSWEASHFSFGIWSFTLQSRFLRQNLAEARWKARWKARCFKCGDYWGTQKPEHELNIKYATLLMISLSRIYILNTYPYIGWLNAIFIGDTYHIKFVVHPYWWLIIVKLMSLGYVWNIGLDIMGNIMGISYWLDIWW